MNTVEHQQLTWRVSSNQSAASKAEHVQKLKRGIGEYVLLHLAGHLLALVLE